jgi:hypothetical protein
MRALIPVISLAFAFAAMPLPAQNLVTNPGFDTDLDGWSLILGSAAWSSDDCCDDANSGSASFPLGPYGMGMLNSACIDVTPGASYDLVVLAETLALPPDFLFGSGTATVTWYDDVASCPYIFLSEPGMTIQPGTGWRSFGATFVAPPTAAAAKVTLMAQTGGLSEGIDVHFDNVRFGPTGSVPVTLQSFEVD